MRIISHTVNRIQEESNNKVVKLDEYKNLFLYLDKPSISADENFD
jgi:hypothetical protein